MWKSSADFPPPRHVLTGGWRPINGVGGLLMKTYTIIPGDGLYTISATSEGGTRRVVAAFPSEQVATDYLRSLQQEAEASAPLAPPPQGRKS